MRKVAAEVRAHGNKDKLITQIVTCVCDLFSLARQRRPSRVDQMYCVRICPPFKHRGGHDISAFDHPAVNVMPIHLYQ